MGLSVVLCHLFADKWTLGISVMLEPAGAFGTVRMNAWRSQHLIGYLLGGRCDCDVSWEFHLYLTLFVGGRPALPNQPPADEAMKGRSILACKVMPLGILAQMPRCVNGHPTVGPRPNGRRTRLTHDAIGPHIAISMSSRITGGPGDSGGRPSSCDFMITRWERSASAPLPVPVASQRGLGIGSILSFYLPNIVR